MAIVERLRRLDNSHPHTRVVAVAPRQSLPGKCTTLHHHFSTINPPKHEYGFTPRGGPNLGKISCVIPDALPHARLLFVQRVAPLPNQQGASWSHRWPWFSRDKDIFMCQGMVERGLSANHSMITEFTRDHMVDGRSMKDIVLTLNEQINFLQSQVYDLQNQVFEYEARFKGMSLAASCKTRETCAYTLDGEPLP